ncbi:hypothetical protein LWC34_55390 [Kibdelosporangium philippinense]|uniref:Uncharacterized protein n=1 Tax=Kibdelosporangium philippinense TaxID=211113 RepID=A0ABS8ZW41_9PSEU|nr:hypothetical protein [Kibdelosporangium philippinense]MCE7011940.1 hypothetical protein [Kibdelosporangium philippinense]
MANSQPNAVSAGTGSDFRVAVVGALMPFGLGLLVLVGYAWIGVFGVILGLLGALWWAVWWRRKHNKKFFPRDVEGGPFVFTLVLSVILFVAALASI